MESKNKKKAPCLAVFGTGSDVGKSIVVTALCRIFAQKGYRVAPFKAQNMSNNSGVTPQGLEMGRAQIVQAEAAGIPPHVDMNPILLKPTSDIGAQVVLSGKVYENSTAIEYHTKKKFFFSKACDALDRLRTKYDLVVMEGAGSCAEVNLMHNDIVNFPIAQYASSPVILVADIHKGGVFAQILGTLQCISQEQRDLTCGFIINRFRGDISLFNDGMLWIEEKTKKKVFGVLPWFNHINIEAEDSVVIEKPDLKSKRSGDLPAIAVIRLPHISNFTDFEPLSALKGLDICFVEKVCDLSPFKAVILPGTKNTRFDLNWLFSTGWQKELVRYAEKQGHILGVCGGYQILGDFVHDPDGLEGKPGTTKGIGLLPVETVLKAPKTTTLTGFLWNNVSGAGYEIHMGHTERKDGLPMFKVTKQNSQKCNAENGCILDNRIMGTYIHGMFDTPGITRIWLDSIGLHQINVSEKKGLVERNRQYDLLAKYFVKHIDLEKIESILKKEIYYE